jgi:hypothetical protein
MVFQADISILYSTRRQTVSELQAGCGHEREHERSSGSDKTTILTGQDKNQSRYSDTSSRTWNRLRKRICILPLNPSPAKWQWPANRANCFSEPEKRNAAATEVKVTDC